MEKQMSGGNKVGKQRSRGGIFSQYKGGSTDQGREITGNGRLKKKD